jgi:uncharacterized membrane protein
MQLSDTGESRIRGYLYVLERSLRGFLPEAVALDASREVESHVRERVGETEPVPDERTALERVLAELGSPLKVARAYSLEMSAEEAVTTGRVMAIARTLFNLAALGIGGFFGALCAFVGYVTGLAFLAAAIMKPVFPNNVGLWIRDGIPIDLGAQFPAPANATLVGSYWIIPIFAAIGIVVLLLTHWCVRRMINAWLRRRRGPGRGALGSPG